MTQQQQFDLFGARQARDVGMAKVADHSGWWFEAAMRRIFELKDWRGTGEEIGRAHV